MAWLWFYFIVRFTVEYDPHCGGMNFTRIWMDTNTVSLFIFAVISISR